MKIKNTKLIKRFEDFILNLKKKDKIAIIHHTDPDGICSAVIMNKIVEKIRKKPIDFIISQESVLIQKSILDQLKNKRINKLIITDICVDQYNSSKLKKIAKFAEIVILDHHKLYKNLNSKKIIHIKPQLITYRADSSAYCVSKLCFDFGSKITDLQSIDWVAAVGIIGDCTFDYWKPFMDSVFKKYNIKRNKNIFKNVLGEIAELIFFTVAYDVNKTSLCYNVLNNSRNYKDLLHSKLQKYRKEIRKEINYWKNNVEELAEVYSKQELIFDFIKPRYPIKAVISTFLGYKYPNKTIIIAEDMNKNFIQLSARRRDYKVAVNDLLENALKGLHGANGGGHVTSAGGKLKKKDIFTFKENILRILERRDVFN
jgi:single-stranded DNA-specific DHH superfamily exonuclease